MYYKVGCLHKLATMWVFGQSERSFYLIVLQMTSRDINRFIWIFFVPDASQKQRDFSTFVKFELKNGNASILHNKNIGTR